MKNPHFISIYLSILMLVCLIPVMKVLPPEVPLMYGDAQGQNQLAPKTFLMLVPIISIFISLINYFIAQKIEDDLYKKALLITSYFINIMVAITLAKIIFTVGFF